MSLETDFLYEFQSCGSRKNIVLVSSQTRFAVHDPRNNDKQVSVSPRVSPFFFQLISFFKPSPSFASGQRFSPPSFPVVVKQVIEMPKKDSTSSDKGASFGGRKPPVVYREGTDMEAQWGWFSFGVGKGTNRGWRVDVKSVK